MPKSSKKKKEKTADFTKARLKLGKGKQPASNTVDTSFKARSINLPQQSISVAKDASVPTTKRKLTLDDLLSHLKHYSPGVRKDALHGLHELLDEYNDLIESNLLLLVNACAPLIADEDANVRKSLHSFFTWLLPRLSRENLAPYASTLLLFTTSAQTHIFPEIRIDAIRFLDILLEYIPEYIVDGCFLSYSEYKASKHGRKVLDGYLGLLNVGVKFNEDESKGAGSSSGSMMLAASSKALILKSLSRFLVHATLDRASLEVRDKASYEVAVPLWYLSSSFSSLETYESFVNLLNLHRSSRKPLRDIYTWRNERTFDDSDDGFTGLFPLTERSASFADRETFQNLQHIADDMTKLAKSGDLSTDPVISTKRVIMLLCHSLNPVLISTFLDCAPVVFSPTQASPEAELQLIQSIMEIARCLYGNLLRNYESVQGQKREAVEELTTLLNHAAVYFPFGEQGLVGQEIKVEQAFQRMNLIYCELFSLLSLVDSSHTAKDVVLRPGNRRKFKGVGDRSSKESAKRLINPMGDNTSRVREYVMRCLQGQIGSNGSIRPIGQSLTPQIYVGLIPTLWWLLDCPTNDSGDQLMILQTVLQHATRVGSTNGLKLMATEFVARLVLLQSESAYQGSLWNGHVSSEDVLLAVREWITHLPKTLWEIGDKLPAASELILVFLLRQLQRKSRWNDRETLSALRTRFVPFFTMQHPIRGELQGPYARLASRGAVGPSESRPLPSLLKRLALDVATLLLFPGPLPQILRRHPVSISYKGGGNKGNSQVSAPLQDSSEKNGVDEMEQIEALRRAVDKAVAGTDEEAYWRSLSPGA